MKKNVGLVAALLLGLLRVKQVDAAASWVGNDDFPYYPNTTTGHVVISASG